MGKDALSCGNKKWFVIDWDMGLRRFKSVLECYHIAEQTEISRDVFVVFGYKILSAGDKETYYFLHDLAILNEKKNGEYKCTVSQDYLAAVLGTSRIQQSRRIKKLTNTGLLCVDNSKNTFNSNIYIPARWALPDSTLLSTLVLLIRRRRLYEMCRDYEKSQTSDEKKDFIVNKVASLIKKIPDGYALINGKIRERF